MPWRFRRSALASENATRIVSCKHCGQRMRVPQIATARFFKCPKCGARIPVGDTGRPDTVEEGGGDQSSGAKVSDPLLQLFRQSGKVAPEHVEEALAVKTAQGGKLYEILIRLGHLKAEDLHSLLSRQPGIAAVHLANIAMDRDMVTLLPHEIALRNFAFPIDRLGKLMTAAMVCPLDMEAIAEIQNHTGLSVKPVLCSLDDFYTVVEKYYHIKRDAGAAGGAPLPPGSVAAGVGAAAPPAPAAKREPETAPPKEEPVPEQEAPAPAPAPVEEAPSIADRIEQLDRLEVSPRVATQMSALVGYGQEGLRKMTELAPWSPPLVATLLSAANSSAYGLPGMVDNIALATALLGEQGVGLICSNMREANPQADKHLGIVSRHSRQTGNVAALLAAACGRSVPSIVQCAGYLHSIGSYALAVLEPEECKKIDRRLVGASRNLAEQEVFGVGHDELGARLLTLWRVPPIVAECVRLYTHPEDAEDFQDMACLVLAASSCVGADGAFNEDISDAGLDALYFLGLSAEQAQAAVAETA